MTFEPLYLGTNNFFECPCNLCQGRSQKFVFFYGGIKVFGGIKLLNSRSDVFLQHPSDQQSECVATACCRCTTDKCIQEQTGQPLNGYGRMKVSATKLINLKKEQKYKHEKTNINNIN